ncbi:MAG TPA: hypothetical protein VFQ12_00045 [Thermoleophilaceae bacterium]|nr:hypothetical protein [Thermoleophilaceae bacterium]
MRAKRTIVLGGLAATLLGGGAAAVAARSGDDGEKRENAILSDAAKRLGVSAEELESALAKAEDAQLDKAVEDGDLTKEQAEAIKERRRASGRVLGVPDGPHGPGFRGPAFGLHFGFGFGGHGDVMEDVAEALGISTSDLFSELRDGKSLAEVAKAHDKSLDDVKSAVRKTLDERIDKALEDGDLTEKQADEIREHLPDLVDRIGERPPGLRHRFDPGDRGGLRPPPPPFWP